MLNLIDIFWRFLVVDTGHCVNFILLPWFNDCWNTSSLGSRKTFELPIQIVDLFGILVRFSIPVSQSRLLNGQISYILKIFFTTWPSSTKLEWFIKLVQVAWTQCFLASHFMLWIASLLFWSTTCVTLLPVCLRKWVKNFVTTLQYKFYYSYAHHMAVKTFTLKKTFSRHSNSQILRHKKDDTYTFPLPRKWFQHPTAPPCSSLLVVKTTFVHSAVREPPPYYIAPKSCRTAAKYCGRVCI